ncbi:MAG: ATP synthase F1 subunit delta [Elusimicrobiota bacterium]
MKKNNSKSYAKSLFQLSVELQETDKTGDSLEMLKPLDDKEITNFFSNPFVDENTKTDIIKNVFPHISETVFNLLLLLIKKNEIKSLSKIIEKYNELILSSKNTVRAKVISAEKLKNSVSEKVKDIIEKITKKNVLLVEETDKSIVGGLIIKAGDLVIDGTIRGKFEEIGRELIK